MNQTSLFELMQDYSPSVIDRTRAQEPTIEAMVLSTILTEDCYAFFSFNEHLKNYCHNYHVPGYKSVMPLSKILHTTLRDAWRACKGKPETQVYWEDKYRDNALRNVKAYIIQIDTLLETKIRDIDKFKTFLTDTKIQFESIQKALTVPHKQ